MTEVGIVFIALQRMLRVRIRSAKFVTKQRKLLSDDMGFYRNYLLFIKIKILTDEYNFLNMLNQTRF